MIRETAERTVKVLREAGFMFITVFLVFPLLATISSFIYQSVNDLLFIHVTSGLVWFLLVVGSPLYCGLLIGGIVPESVEKRFSRNIPSLTVLAFSFGLTAVVSGTFLYLQPSASNAETGLWRIAALILAWTIFMIGLLGPNRYHIGEYFESITEEPDPERIRSLRRRNALIGLVEAVLITIFVVAMNFL